jgi:hypothetical protein
MQRLRELRLAWIAMFLQLIGYLIALDLYFFSELNKPKPSAGISAPVLRVNFVGSDVMLRNLCEEYLDYFCQTFGGNCFY